MSESNQYFIPSTNICIVNGWLAIYNTLKLGMLKCMMEVLIGDLPMDPKASTGKCAFCGPSGKMRWGQGKLLLFTQRKFQTNSGALKREALSLSPHSWRTIGMLILTTPKPENVSQGLFCSYSPLFYSSFLVLAQASSQSEFKSCIEKHLEVGIMLKPHAWLISMLFSFRGSEWVTLVCDLHSYRAHSVLYSEIKHCQSTVIYKCIY